MGIETQCIHYAFWCSFSGNAGIAEYVNGTLCWKCWWDVSFRLMHWLACKLKDEQEELYVYAMHETNGCFYFGFMNVMIGPSKHHQTSICKTDMYIICPTLAHWRSMYSRLRTKKKKMKWQSLWRVSLAEKCWVVALTGTETVSVACWSLNVRVHPHFTWEAQQFQVSIPVWPLPKSLKIWIQRSWISNF